MHELVEQLAGIYLYFLKRYIWFIYYKTPDFSNAVTINFTAIFSRNHSEIEYI